MACRRSPGDPMRSVLAAVVGFAPWLAIAITASARAGERAAGDGRLAVTPNGQQVCRIDRSRRAVVAFDPRQPGVAREIVGPIEGPAFVTVAYLAGDVVAAVCREGDAWSLQTYRTQPGGAVEASAPLQLVALGEAPGPSEDVDIAVSHARGWLAITGLPPPLPPVLRAVLAGVRVGPVSRPRRPASGRPRSRSVRPMRSCWCSGRRTPTAMTSWSITIGRDASSSDSRPASGARSASTSAAATGCSGRRPATSTAGLGCGDSMPRSPTDGRWCGRCWCRLSSSRTTSWPPRPAPCSSATAILPPRSSGLIPPTRRPQEPRHEPQPS